MGGQSWEAGLLVMSGTDSFKILQFVVIISKHYIIRVDTEIIFTQSVLQRRKKLTRQTKLSKEELSLLTSIKILYFLLFHIANSTNSRNYLFHLL